MDQVLLVMCNVPDLASARSIASRLIDSRAAACVNVGAAVESIYRWNGMIETATEVPLAIKTVGAKYAEVEAVIRGLHPYEVPEIVAFPLIAGLPDYLAWVRAETA